MPESEDERGDRQVSEADKITDELLARLVGEAPEVAMLALQSAQLAVLRVMRPGLSDADAFQALVIGHAMLCGIEPSNDGEVVAAIQYALVACVKMTLVGATDEMILASITATTAQTLGLVKHEDTLAIVRSFMPTQKEPS